MDKGDKCNSQGSKGEVKISSYFAIPNAGPGNEYKHRMVKYDESKYPSADLKFHIMFPTYAGVAGVNVKPAQGKFVIPPPRIEIIQYASRAAISNSDPEILVPFIILPFHSSTFARVEGTPYVGMYAFPRNSLPSVPAGTPSVEGPSEGPTVMFCFAPSGTMQANYLTPKSAFEPIKDLPIEPKKGTT